MRLAQLKKPEGLPVTINDAREQCALVDGTHDSLLTRLIKSATNSIEQETGSRLMTQEIMVVYDGFPCGLAEMDLGLYPVQTIDNFAYDDEDNTAQSLDVDVDYYESLVGLFPVVSPVGVWPTAKANKSGSVRINVTAGYTDADAVPDEIKHAILVRVKEMYAQRGESVTGASVESTQLTVDALLATYTRVTV